MELKNIGLNDLVVNRANDRHGEMMSEEAAIEWLLKHRAQHMRNLAKDIVEAGEIYEPPLVSPEDGKFTVYDGNRRTTTIKLLNEPQKAPSQDWAKFYAGQKKKWRGKFPTSLPCQIERDRERLDEILYRRHTGQQSGVGQSQWDPAAKFNFEKRTGKRTKINVAEEIENLLRKAGRLKPDERIPRSNLNRLLSAEQFRNRVGIALEGNKLVLTHREDTVVDALEKIAKDLMSKEVTLDDLWNNDDKRKYLNDLDEADVLPKPDAALSTKAPPTKKPKLEESKTKDESKAEPDAKAIEPETRRTLIRNIDYGFVQVQHNRRALDIFTELQHKLKFGEHDNAIAVLFRILLEISLEIYIEQKHLPDVHAGDKLSNKYSKALSHMVDNGYLEKKYADAIRKFEKSEALFSTNTLHAYVHNKDFFPSDHHLKTMWDTLDKFVSVCLKV